MHTAIRHATRAITISDLHLANGQPDMIADPTLLTQFILQLPQLFPVDGSVGEKLELIIAGDFIDYLNIREYSAWTVDPAAAVRKLGDVVDRSQFVPVFDALRTHLSRGHRLTVLLGNHDVEMALPQVQAAFLERLGASPHEVLFVMDGRAYRLGGALIEHGNRYDDANANDWTGLRSIVSALSRDESPPVDLEVSAGSKLVIKVVNPLKDAYPFVNLLQPVGEILLLLLLEFEPSLAWQIDMLGRLVNGKRLADRNRLGRQPGATKNVSSGAGGDGAVDAELLATFGDAYTQLRANATANVAAGDVLGLLVRPGRDGLAAMFERGEAVPPARLRKIRVALKRIVDSDLSATIDAADGPCGSAAVRLLRDSRDTEAVIMGHTHLPRFVRAEGGIYMNSGTWIDRLRIPAHVLSEGAEPALESFLRDLKADRRAPCAPTCAELRLDATGRVRRAALCEIGRRGDELIATAVRSASVEAGA